MFERGDATIDRENLTWGGVFFATLLFTATLVGGLLVVRVPATYFSGFRVEFGHFRSGAALPLGPGTG